MKKFLSTLVLSIALVLPMVFFVGCGPRIYHGSVPADRFSLEITASETTVRRGRRIAVEVTLTNLSGKRLEISLAGIAIRIPNSMYNTGPGGVF